LKVENAGQRSGLLRESSKTFGKFEKEKAGSLETLKSRLLFYSINLPDLI
jgi:hypothetical protein